MLTVRPINNYGTWGDKQKKEYILDKSGDKSYDPKKRDAYYKKHEREIEQYRTAYQYLKDHLNGRTAIPEKEWRAEHAALTAERYTLCEEYYKLRDDVKSVETLRRGAEHIMSEDAPEQTRTRQKDVSL